MSCEIIDLRGPGKSESSLDCPFRGDGLVPAEAEGGTIALDDEGGGRLAVEFGFMKLVIRERWAGGAVTTLARALAAVEAVGAASERALLAPDRVRVGKVERDAVVGLPRPSAAVDVNAEDPADFEIGGRVPFFTGPGVGIPDFLTEAGPITPLRLGAGVVPFVIPVPVRAPNGVLDLPGVGGRAGPGVAGHFGTGIIDFLGSVEVAATDSSTGIDLSSKSSGKSDNSDKLVSEDDRDREPGNPGTGTTTSEIGTMTSLGLLGSSG